ncbi:transposable element Tcb2 transposase [Trichonephila clavipes]|nr:transposable element Tcb2 transposase [Trichonephila clavipes]
MPREGAFHHLIIASYPRQDKRSKGNSCAIQHDFMLLTVRRIFIWRDRGSRNNPAFVHESVRFCGGGVLVYGGISIDGRTYLYIIRDGPLTARRYRDEILRPIVVPLRCSNRR